VQIFPGRYTCRYGKKCSFSHEQQDNPGILELLQRLQVARILTGFKLEDVNEIIENQNEMIKEQALEIVNLKMSLDRTIIARSNEVRKPQPMTNKHTQCHVLTSDNCSNTDDCLFLSCPKIRNLG
jgi:hypothetical protein